MKLLILGASGNLGTQLMKMAGAQYEIVGWDAPEVDLLDFVKLEAAIKELKPDVIINAVAYNAVDKCEGDEGEKTLAFRLNEKLPELLAEIAIELKCTLVHYSTDYVFDGQSRDGYIEDSATGPINVYGQSKEAGELALKRALVIGANVYLIRTSKLFGPRGTSQFAKPSFFAVMLNLVSDGSKETVDVVDEEVSCFTYTVDLAEVTYTLIKSYAPGLYHMANQGAVTWYEAAKYLFELVGSEVKVNPIPASRFPRPAKRPEYSELLNTKGPDLRSWKEAVADYVSKL